MNEIYIYTHGMFEWLNGFICLAWVFSAVLGAEIHSSTELQLKWLGRVFELFHQRRIAPVLKIKLF